MTREYQPLVKFRPSEAELQPVYTNERLRQSEEATGELGHLAISMVTGGAVDADNLGRAEFAQQQTAELEAAYKMEAIADRERNIHRNLGAVASLDAMYGYDELRKPTATEEQRAALEYANRSRYGLTA